MDDQIRELLKLGRDAYRKREYSRAEGYLLKVLEQEDRFADLFNMLGVICHDRGLFKKAQQYFERALSLNHGYTEAALNLAVTYNDLGRYHDAKQVFNRALATTKSQPGELDPFVRGKIANMYADIGDVFLSSGLYQEAEREYVKALALGPGFVDIRLKLAQVLREQGRGEEAIAQLEQIIKERPTYFAARIHLGVSLYALGRMSEAVSQWQAVLDIDPDNKSCQTYIRMVEDEESRRTP